MEELKNSNLMRTFLLTLGFSRVLRTISTTNCMAISKLDFQPVSTFCFWYSS
jgi:hypothetical protein